LAEALGETRERRADPAGIVRMHCFRAAADLYLTPILRAFSDAFPHVILDVTLDDAVVDIVAEGYDVAIRLGEVIDKDLIAVKLGPDLRQTAVASPDYLARHGAPAHPRDLLAHRCIGWRWPGQKSPHKWEFMENGKWFEVAVDGPLISNLKDFGVQAAVDGVGIAFASRQLIAPHILQGSLVPLLEAWSAPFSGYYLCYPAQRRDGAAAPRPDRHHPERSSRHESDEPRRQYTGGGRLEHRAEKWTPGFPQKRCENKSLEQGVRFLCRATCSRRRSG
jgi:DNA-binding transcriptional LysR family regulator